MNTGTLIRVGQIGLVVLKWTGLVMVWFYQYAFHVWMISIPVRMLQVGGKVVLVILACSVVGWPILLIWLIFFKDRPAKERRPIFKPWFT